MRRKSLVIFLILAIAIIPGFAVLNKYTDPWSNPAKVSDKNSLDSFYKQKLNWKSCYAQFECASFQVPIDYKNLKLGTFNIAAMQHRATKPVGNVVVNPGGPGGSGIDYAYSYDVAFTLPLIKSMNIVGFDPRGVGRSAPIKCLNNSETDRAYSEDTKPGNTAEIAKLEAASKAYANTCKSRNKYLQYYTTANTARDMDIFRTALGEAKLNYIGKSYGTYLGTLYAKLFPNNVGRFVLDGAVDPTASSMAQTLEQAVGFDKAFGDFVNNCKRLGGCVFGADPVNQVKNELAKLAKKPLKVGKRELTESLAMYGIASGLYDKATGWTDLRAAFRDWFAGNGATMLALADVYTGRQPDGKYANNEADSLAVISCNDWNTTSSTKSQIELFKSRAPLFGIYVAYSDGVCKYLPHQSAELITAPIMTSTDVVVIGTLRDPATPYTWSVNLSKYLIGSKLISLNSDGHTAYARGSTCIDQVVEKYLISGVIPAGNLTCLA